MAFALLMAFILPGETLRSIKEINAFIEEAAPGSNSFALTGTVFSALRLPETGEIILAGKSGDRLQFYRPLDLSQPEAGDTISAAGIASISEDYEPYIRLDDFNVISHGTQPAPLNVRLPETNAKKHHLMTIRTQGVVIDAFPDEVDLRFIILLLKDGDAVIPVTLQRDIFGDRRDLVDATIKVTGIYRQTVGGVRKFSWPNITPRTPEDIEIVVPPPKDPFAAAPIEKRLYMTSDEIARMSKRSVTGEVLATWSGDTAMLRTADGRIVNIRFTHGERLPPCGETIMAVGMPETDFFRINLSAAQWKDAKKPAKPDKPETATDAVTAFWNHNVHNALRGESHGKLLSARGIVRTLPSADSTGLRFVLDTGDLSIPVDITSNPSVIDTLQIGSEIKATGRCILLTETGRRNYSSAKIKGFALVIRSPADITVINLPSWWTLKRMTGVISLLLAAVIAIYIWNRYLHNLVNRRGRELYREQVAHAVSEFKRAERTRLAVELHDSLSQTLSGVACHMAVAIDAFDTNPGTARQCLATARKMLNACRTELRQCLFVLRSDTLEEQDFSSAIRKTLNQIDSDTSIKIDFAVPRRLFKDTTAHAILAIIRELTGNAILHGKATEISITGKIDAGELIFTVIDNGVGFDPMNCKGPLQGHFGIEGIRNRLEKLNGRLAINSQPGVGTEARVTIPLPSPQSPEDFKE